MTCPIGGRGGRALGGLVGTRTTRRIRVNGSIRPWGRRWRKTSRSETSPGQRAGRNGEALLGRAEKKCCELRVYNFSFSRQGGCVYVSCRRIALSLSHSSEVRRQSADRGQSAVTHTSSDFIQFQSTEAPRASTQTQSQSDKSLAPQSLAPRLHDRSSTFLPTSAVLLPTADLAPRPSPTSFQPSRTPHAATSS